MNKILVLYKSFVVLLLLGSCSSYNQGILMRIDEEADNTLYNSIPEPKGKNYIISPNDRLEVELYNYGGEALIDPYFRPVQDNAGSNNNLTNRRVLQYLVNADGTIILPKIGEQKVDGMSLTEAEMFFEGQYREFYTNTFIQVRFVNTRVVFHGPEGGQVIPLENENTHLSEILSLYGNIGPDVKINQIRVLRGENLFLADFSTPESFIKTDIIIENGDIIYVEPVIRPFAESARDYGPVINLLTGLISVTALIITITSSP